MSNAPTPSQITITIGQYELTGWESYTYHAGLDIVPWQLEVSATLHQAKGADLNLTEGMTATARLGNDLLLTGYLVTIRHSISAYHHSISLLLSSRTLDLTDCSGSMVTSDLMIGGNESSGRTLSSMLSRLCAPFGVSILVDKGVDVPTVPFFAINLTETPFAIMDRLCRQVGVIFTDTPEGNIRLTTVGSAAPAISIAYGDKVEEYEEQHSTNGRYSVIKAVLQTSQLLSQEPQDSNYVSQVKASEAGKQATDPGITRNRPLLIPVDLGDANFEVAGKRVLWEVARRYGRSNPISVAVSTHRDKTGALYRPNMPVTLTKPDGTQASLIINDINFEGSTSGTRTHMTLLPANSLTPQPIVNKLASKAAVAAQNDSSNQ